MSLSHHTEQSEQSRRLLRHVSEAVRRIEERHQAASKVEAVFSLELLVLRSRLKELTTRLIALDPVKLGSKAMEVYWRKAYHEPVALARQLKEEQLTKAQLALVEAQLAAGIGHYHHSITSLCQQYNWSHSLTLDFSIAFTYGYSGAGAKRSPGARDNEAELGGWVEAAVTRCLVYLGDLARYLVELCSAQASLPARYYLQAVKVRPAAGVAYNQLGTLSGQRNHGLDQLYYYLRASICSEGGEGGEANLQRQLEKAEVVYMSSDKEPGVGEAVVGGLLHLVAVVVASKDQEQVTLACQASLGSLHHMLASEDSDQSLEGPWLPLVVSVMVTLQARLIRKDQASGTGHTCDYRLGLCQAWLLALLSHLALRLATFVGKRLWGASWQLPPVTLPEVKEEEEEEEGVPAKTETKKRKNKLDELLRRRRRRSGSISEGDDGESGEDEESSSEIFLSDDSDSELSERGDVLNSSSDDEDEDLDVVVEEEEEKLPSESEIVATVEEAGGVLPSICLCLSWLAAEMAQEVLAQAGPGSEQLWKNLAVMFTVLGAQTRPSGREQGAKLERWKAEGRLGGALWEDWLVRGLVGEGALVKGERDVRNSAQAVVRLERLRAAREWLCEHRDSKIAWSQHHNMAYLRKEAEEKQEKESKKEKMKHMAELWLRQEVKELEEQEAEQESRGVVVVDGSCLAHGLSTLKRVVSLRRCVVVVPAVAVQQLDYLKRNKRGARDAIRWLERQLGRGNSHLRAQGEGEAERLQGSEYPRQRRRAEWDRFQLLECVNYFLVRAACDVTLVTGDTDILSGEASFPSLEGDWRIEDIETFGVRYLGERRPEHQGRREGGGGGYGRRGEGKAGPRRRGGRGKLGSPAGQESSKG